MNRGREPSDVLGKPEDPQPPAPAAGLRSRPPPCRAQVPSRSHRQRGSSRLLQQAVGCLSASGRFSRSECRYGAQRQAVRFKAAGTTAHSAHSVGSPHGNLLNALALLFLAVGIFLDRRFSAPRGNSIGSLESSIAGAPHVPQPLPGWPRSAWSRNPPSPSLRLTATPASQRPQAASAPSVKVGASPSTPSPSESPSKRDEAARPQAVQRVAAPPTPSTSPPSA